MVSMTVMISLMRGSVSIFNVTLVSLRIYKPNVVFLLIILNFLSKATTAMRSMENVVKIISYVLTKTVFRIHCCVMEEMTVVTIQMKLIVLHLPANLAPALRSVL